MTLIRERGRKQNVNVEMGQVISPSLIENQEVNKTILSKLFVAITG